jgi:hypothetical protein
VQAPKDQKRTLGASSGDWRITGDIVSTVVDSEDWEVLDKALPHE